MASVSQRHREREHGERRHELRPHLAYRAACFLSYASCFAGVVLLFNFAEAAERPSTSSNSHAVVVEALGSVPGFTQAQLTAFLAQRMHEETANPWEFLAAKPGMASAPNRVVWSFKTLRQEWKGGSHKGFPAPTASVSYLSAEVKLYLRDTYQITISVHPSVSGRRDDAALTEMVHNVARGLFVDNIPDMP